MYRVESSIEVGFTRAVAYLKYLGVMGQVASNETVTSPLEGKNVNYL